MKNVKSMKVGEIASFVGGTLCGDGEAVITGVAGIREAQPSDATFLSNPRYSVFLSQTAAGVVLAPEGTPAKGRSFIYVRNPSEAFSKLIAYFSPSAEDRPFGTHPSAVVEPNVTLPKNVFVGAQAVIEQGTVVGERTRIHAGVFVGRDCRLGRDVQIYPNVTVREGSVIGDRSIIHSGAVIGSDGFGYETLNGVHVKIPQTGHVVIEEDVEIGANVCVDRGRFGATRIGRGTKIDNLVQIAHNVEVGPGCIVVSQAGISGSSKLGKNVIVAGQAGVVGHLTVGDGAVIGASAGVTKSVEAGQTVLGSPAREIHEQKRLFAFIARLPEIFKDVGELKKKIFGDGRGNGE